MRRRGLHPVSAALLALLLWQPVTVLLSPGGRGAMEHLLVDQHRVVLDTLALAVVAAVVTTGLGTMLAAVRHRYRFRGRTALHLTALSPLVLPPVCASVALLQVWGNNGLLARITGGPIGHVYGMGGLVAADVLAMTPVAYLVVLSALRALDPGVVEQARDMGMNRWQVVKEVVAPRLRPPLAGVFLLLVAHTVVDIANPLVLGGGFEVLSTRLREAALAEGDTAAAAASAAVMVAVCGLAAAVMPASIDDHPLQWHAPARGHHPSSAAARLCVAAAWAVAAVGASVVVLTVIGAVPVHLRSGPGRGWGALADERVAVADSLLVASTTTVLAVVLALSGARGRAARGRRRSPVSRVLLASSAPVLPLALGALLLWRRRAEALAPGPAATWALLALVCLVQCLVAVPMTSVLIRHRIQAITPGPDQTAAALAVPRRSVLEPLVLPALRSPLTVVATVVMARCLTSVPSVILLTGPDTPFLASRIVVEAEAGRVGAASSLALVSAILVCLWSLGVAAATGLLGAGSRAGARTAVARPCAPSAGRSPV